MKFRLLNGDIGYLNEDGNKHLWVMGKDGELVETDIDFDSYFTKLVISVPNKGNISATVEYGITFNCDADLSYSDDVDDYDNDDVAAMILYALDSDDPVMSDSWDCGLSFTAEHTPACVEIEG